MVTAIASRLSAKQIKTFSVGYRGYANDELPYARQISRLYKTDHLEYYIKPDSIENMQELAYQFEEPFADPSIIPTWQLMKETAKHVKVALNGDGGDENFAGYRRYQLMKMYKFLRILPFKSLFKSVNDLVYRLVKAKDLTYSSKAILFSKINDDYSLFYQELSSFITTDTRAGIYSREFRKKISGSRSGFLVSDVIKTGAKKFEYLDKFLFADIKTYLPGVLLAKSDLASMAHSLEMRSPFLDHEFMELAAKMPDNFKMRNFSGKYILKKLAEKYLPPKIIYRKKQGFVPPLETWIRKNSSFISANILDSKFIAYGIFEKEKLKDLVNQHMSSKANNTYPIWTILMLKNWLNTWFK